MAQVMRFDEYMDEALYGAVGFYQRGGRPAARGGDFATAPELGSLFARCVASYLDQVWHELGRPDPFVVVEGGAGHGTLCQQVLRFASDCRGALRYVMVERVAHQRDEAVAAVRALEAENGAETPVDGTSGARPVPQVTASADLPTGPYVGVVLANELLDNLPFRLLERSQADWQEVHVERKRSIGGAAARPANPRIISGSTRGTSVTAPTGFDETSQPVGSASVSGDAAEVLREAPSDAAAMAQALAPRAAAGARVPLQLKAAVWVRRALQLLERGRVLIVDYGVPTTAELAALPASDWLRTYRAQRRAPDPLRGPGSADITCDVAFDQLPPDATLTAQADWLAAAGIDTMTAEARVRWQRGRANPTRDVLAARAVLDEAAALTDPDGMGAFWVAEWRID